MRNTKITPLYERLSRDDLPSPTHFTDEIISKSGKIKSVFKAKGVFIPVSSLPGLEPQIAAAPPQAANL